LVFNEQIVIISSSASNFFLLLSDQAICFPLSNYKWTIHRSHIMLALAWFLSITFSIPQTIVYNANNKLGFCVTEFQPVWGSKVRQGGHPVLGGTNIFFSADLTISRHLKQFFPQAVHPKNEP
jgi:hypothetical protein